MENNLNVDRLMRALSDIFSDKYGVEVTFKATQKEGAGDRAAKQAC